MANALMFLLGFSSIVSVYEIAKTGKKCKADKVARGIEKCKKYLK